MPSRGQGNPAALQRFMAELPHCLRIGAEQPRISLRVDLHGVADNLDGGFVVYRVARDRHEAMPDHSMANAEEWAAGEAIDSQSLDERRSRIRASRRLRRRRGRQGPSVLGMKFLY